MINAGMELHALLERVRWEVVSLLAKTPRLDLPTLYKQVSEALGEDTDMAVASVISLLLRAHKIVLEPLSYDDPTAGMQVMVADGDLAFA
jgi:hypothetical protein